MAQNKLIQLKNYIEHTAKLSSDLEERGEKIAMINRETGLPSNSWVEMTLKAIADWVSIYRNAAGFNDEFGMCEPDEVMRMAKEIGVTPSQLDELAKGPVDANLLKTMLIALHVDPKVLADLDPLIMRELKWLCITCSNKKRCEHELAGGTATEHFREFCPNAVSLDELLGQKGQLSSH